MGDPTPRVLIVSMEQVGPKMTSVGMRAYELARALQPHAEVTVAAPEVGATPDDSVRCVAFDPDKPRSLSAQIAAADVIVARPAWPQLAAQLRRSDARVIFDIPDPELFQPLETFSQDRSVQGRLATAMSVDRLIGALRTGHHFICANERQRDVLIGAMLAERLIRPEAYKRDPSFLSVIDTVPFGVPADPPRRTDGGGPRDRFPAIGPDDEIVLWNSGIPNWFDPQTAVRAMGLLAKRRPQARLVFMATLPFELADRATREARTAATELGLLDRFVFFNDGWVPYADRANWLLDAHCAIATYEDHLETRYAFRTRFLDCIWAGLPVVCSRGDELAARIEREELGATVPPQDEEALATAIEHVLDHGRDAYAERLARVAAESAWPTVAEPLIRFVTSPAPPSSLGGGLPRLLAWRPSQRLRNGVYTAGRRGLNVLGRHKRRTF
jgi:glycosyltransferase involved in cell wall biosynthesis